MNTLVACLMAAVCALEPPHIDTHRGPDQHILAICGGWWCHTWDETTTGTFVCTIRVAISLEPHYRAEKEAEERAACMVREGHP
jgi:hypothetical protein